MKTLEVIGLEKSFSAGLFRAPHVVLKQISFSIESAVTTGFIGINGSGKTTSLKCALGFIFPTKGEVLFWGNPRSKQTLARIGYLPERPYLPDFLTAKEFLQLHWDLSGGGAGFPEQMKSVLSRVNLPGVEQRRLRQFSKGMLQRVGMAQALLRNPDFLILDEPMSGLDPDGRLLMKEIIRDEQKRGTTIFFSSHLLGDMEELCKNVVVIDQGEVLYQGALAKLSLQADSELLILSSDPQQNLVETPAAQAQLHATIDILRQQGHQILRINPRQIGIEKAFEQLRKGGHR